MARRFLADARLAVVRSGDMGLGQETTYIAQIRACGGELVSSADAAAVVSFSSASAPSSVAASTSSSSSSSSSSAARSVSSPPQLRLVVGDAPTLSRVAAALGVQEGLLAARVGAGALRVVSHRWLQSCLEKSALVDDARFHVVLGGAGGGCARAAQPEAEGGGAAGGSGAHPGASGVASNRRASSDVAAVSPSKRARAAGSAAAGGGGAGGLSAAGIAAMARAAASGVGAVRGTAAAAAPATTSATSSVAAPLDASAWRGAAYRQPAVRFRGGGELTPAQRYSGTELVPTFEGLTRLVLPPRAPGRGLARILSYNVHGVESKHARGLASVLASFDVVALQETLRPHAVVHALLSPLGFDVFTHARARASSTFGVALALRGALAEGAAVTHRDFVPLGAAAPEAHRSLTVEVPRLGGTVVVFHRPYGDAEAEEWLLAFVAHVRALVRAGRRVMLCGDLNATPEQDHDAWALRALGMRDATEGTAELHHPSHFPASRAYDFQRLDYILLCPRAATALVPCSGRVLSVGAPWGDHVPVEATLRLPDGSAEGGGGY